MSTDQANIPTGVDFVTITNVVQIGTSSIEAWRRIGSFATAGRFLDVPSNLSSGEGGIGSVRQIGDGIIEAMVGASDTSYVYVQTKGPMAQYSYHGSVALSATGADSCTLTYVITYDQASMTPEARQEVHARITGRFMGAAEAMKRVAEGGGA